MWGHYISDTAGILNQTNPEEACLTEDGTHDFCPDGTSGGEPGAGSDFTVFLNGREDSFSGVPGNDLILANDHDKDNLIDCGPGRHDFAVIDKVDPKPKHCEKVR